MTKNKGCILKIILCFLATIGLSKYFEINNSFIVCIVFALFLLSYSKQLKFDSSKASALLSVVIAIILVIGKQLDVNGTIYWSLGTLVRIFCLTISVYIPSSRLLNSINDLRLKSNFVLSRKHKVIITAIFLVSNFVILLALYPGIYGWDSALQAYRAINGGVTSHYSVLLGAIFGLILKIGKNIFGSYSAGLFISMLLQSIIVSLIYAKIVFFINEKYKNCQSTIVAAVYFVGNLLLGAMAVYSTQDTLFGVVFALLFIELWNLCQDPKYWNDKKNMARYIILALLLCVFRNNGVYILTITLIATIIAYRKHLKKIVLIMVVPIILAFVYSGPFLAMLGIQKTDTLNEMLSVPSQQLARVYSYRQDNLSKEEKDKLEYYYDDIDAFKEYIHFEAKADKTKGALNSEKVKCGFVDYILLWGKVGIKNPRMYIEAFLLNSLGTWYPNKEFNDPRANIPYIEYGMNTLWDEYDGKYSEMKIDRDSKFKAYEQFLSYILYENGWQNYPILSSIYSIGTYFILTTAFVIIIIHKKRYTLIIPVSLIIGLYATVLVGPVSIFRYCYPVLIVAPLLCIGLIKCINGRL